MSASNTTLALVVTMGGAVLAWTGVVDPPGGLTGAMGRVLNRQAPAGAGRAKADPLSLVPALYTAPGGATTPPEAGGVSSGGAALPASTKGTLPLIRPVSQPFTGRWGHYPSGGLHPALDFPCPPGTPVHAAAGGTVTFAGWDTTGYGWCVRLTLTNGWKVTYGHNSALLVHTGQTVAPGQVIAKSGSSGNSTGPHVHMGVATAAGVAFDFTPHLVSGGLAA